MPLAPTRLSHLTPSPFVPRRLTRCQKPLLNPPPINTKFSSSGPTKRHSWGPKTFSPMKNARRNSGNPTSGKGSAKVCGRSRTTPPSKPPDTSPPRRRAAPRMPSRSGRRKATGRRRATRREAATRRGNW
ncbi:hypothetical protein llap_22420 [Limosa lapponica baueri]|uniref:Uncharacterized protein n=1 Tax=Limosa lapponica baueri TaxID=1758121 RepID=A0A2I0T0G3_LIMLA|nr:hypothetical protein llap_22420 [Limosa lapponica baueri]